jgi:hypothetical protein
VGLPLILRGLKMTYYDHEIARVGDIPAALKLQNEQGQTRWMTVTPEQIKQILDILNKEKVTT